MKFFVENQEVESQIKNVLGQIKLRMNGETSSQMSALGMKYRKNSGVSLMHIKEIAARISPNYELAERLWYRQERECMLIALQIVPKEFLDLKVCVEWAQLIDNTELIEQSALHLFSKLPFARELVDVLLDSQDIHHRSLGYYTLAWHHNFFETPSVEYMAKFLAVDLIIDEDYTYLLHKAKTFLVRKVVRSSKGGSNAITNYIHFLQDSGERSLCRLASDIELELDYVKSL